MFLMAILSMSFFGCSTRVRQEKNYDGTRQEDEEDGECKDNKSEINKETKY